MKVNTTEGHIKWLIGIRIIVYLTTQIFMHEVLLITKCYTGMCALLDIILVSPPPCTSSTAQVRWSAKDERGTAGKDHFPESRTPEHEWSTQWCLVGKRNCCKREGNSYSTSFIYLNVSSTCSDAVFKQWTFTTYFSLDIVLIHCLEITWRSSKHCMDSLRSWAFRSSSVQF